MPRDLPIGNGSLFISFDRRYNLVDLYYPHVGQENHGGHPWRCGVWTEDGFAWTDDGTTMYHSDSKGQVIWAYDYADGEIANRRGVARPTEEVGRPDGAATDVDGYYWSAGISAGVLNRWAPDGHLDRSIPLPCSNPTMPCFGGPDLRTIYVTSLRHDLPPAVLAAKPLSGGIFAIEVEVPGVPVARFTG